MLAKLVEGVIDPAAGEPLADAVEKELIPSLLELDGAASGYWMSDGSSGRVVAITLWDGEHALRSAAAIDGADRATVADRIAMRVLSVHTMPVLASSMESADDTAEATCRSARVTWVEGVPPSARAHLPELYEAIVADQLGTDGFCGSFWFGEEQSGEGCAVSMWEQPSHLAGGALASRRRQRRAARALGCRISKVHEYQILGVAHRARVGTGDRRPARAVTLPA